jgi:GT2 family glycosyltransferase
MAEKDENIGLIQPKILNYKDLSIDNVGFSCDIFGYTEPIRNFEETNFKEIKSKRKLFYLSGACIMINKNLVLEIDKNGNLFDKDLFAYFEDTDLAWRARMLKYDIKVCLSSICYHKGSQTTKRFNINTFYLDYRNKLRVFLKNYSLLSIILIIPVNVLLKFITVVAKTIYFLNIGYLKSFLKAIRWNIREFPNTLKLRCLAQSTKRATDREIIKYMEHVPLWIKAFLEKIGNEGR